MLAVGAPGWAGVFADVPMDNWEYNAVETLSRLGIPEGYENIVGSQPMTRYDYVMLTARSYDRLLRVVNTARYTVPTLIADTASLRQGAEKFRLELTNMGRKVDEMLARLDSLHRQLTAADGRLHPALRTLLADPRAQAVQATFESNGIRVEQGLVTVQVAFVQPESITLQQLADLRLAVLECELSGAVMRAPLSSLLHLAALPGVTVVKPAG
jgi:hypothetical protein